MIFYFTREGFDALNAKIREVEGRIEDLEKGTGAACQTGHETWHDNFDYEEGVRQQRMWSKRLDELVDIKRNVRVIEPAQSGRAVAIGRTITILDEDTAEIWTFRIGSYMIFRENSEISEVSYAAPLAIFLAGSMVGDVRSGIVGQEKKRFLVLAVE